jgi:phage FluMu protein Com
MQLRCTYCQTMFAIGREEKLIAIQTMNDDDLQYYHAYCPKCRRANRVERKKLERSYPNWQEDLKARTDALAEESLDGKDK